MSAYSKPGITLNDLALPDEFEDLGGLLVADLKSLVAMIAQRADERLLLTRREGNQLRARLWNGLADAINEAVEPLTAERR